jgi:hypothetical protein
LSSHCAAEIGLALEELVEHRIPLPRKYLSKRQAKTISLEELLAASGRMG